jgi:Copper transport outer membrane protein, MctB
VERTLSDAGAGSPVRLVALDTPIDPNELDAKLNGDDQLARYAQGGGDFGDLGEALGRDLVQGDGTPLWTSLSSSLIEERSGTTASPVDGAIAVQTWQPPETEGDADQKSKTDATQSLFEGLVRGLEDSGVPVVGVQTTSAEDDLALFRQQGVSSVDDVDALAGRLALALLLAGGQPGHYGVKDSATDGVAPPIESVPTTTSG